MTVAEMPVAPIAIVVSATVFVVVAAVVMLQEDWRNRLFSRRMSEAAKPRVARPIAPRLRKPTST